MEMAFRTRVDGRFGAEYVKNEAIIQGRTEAFTPYLSSTPECLNIDFNKYNEALDKRAKTSSKQNTKSTAMDKVIKKSNEHLINIINSLDTFVRNCKHNIMSTDCQETSVLSVYMVDFVPGKVCDFEVLARMLALMLTSWCSQRCLYADGQARSDQVQARTAVSVENLHENG
jgi:hypothetical protein